MARIRSVHPELCRDRTLVDVSAEAERTFVRLWPHLDDDGRAIDDALLLKADLYPIHTHVTEEHVERDLRELAAAGLIIRYEVNGERFLTAKPDRWVEWQKPRHRYPSKFPGPTDDGARPVPAEQVPDDVGRASDVGQQDAASDVRRTPVGPGTAVVEGREVDEVGGGASGERLPQQHDLLLPKGCAPSLLEELDGIIGALLARYPATKVDEAVQRFVDDRSWFPWPSDVRAALTAALGAPVSAVKESRVSFDETHDQQLARLQAQREWVDDERDREAIDEQIAELLAKAAS